MVRARYRNQIFQFVLIIFIISVFFTSQLNAAVFSQGNVLIYTKDRIYEYSTNGTRIQRISAPSVRYLQHGITMTTNNRVALNDVNQLHLYDSNKNQWSTITSSGVDAGVTSGDGKIAAYCNSVFSGDSLGSSTGIVRYDLLQLNYFRDPNNIASNISIGLDGFLYIGNNKFDPVSLENIAPAIFLSPPGNIIDRVANKSGTQFVISSSPYHAIYRVSKAGVREAVLYTGYYNVKNLIDIDINDAGNVVVGNTDGQVLITDENFKSLRIIDLSSDDNSTPAYVAFVSTVQGFNVNKLSATESQTGFLNSETCTKLLSGNVAQNINRVSAAVTQAEIANYYATTGMDTAVVVDAQNSTVTYYDIDIVNTNSGNSSLVTIPLDTTLQTTSKVARLIMPQGWSDFVINTSNTVSSTKMINGSCPLPGDNVYTSGLSLNNSCLQLKIEDGGPNDIDGIQNKHIQLIIGITNVVDTDGDGVPDSLDAFPLDATETKDSDGDGVGDNKDAFPLDPTETNDSDGDGVGDNKDAFPLDPTKSTGIDSDGDGIVDSIDAFPLDPTETNDSDGDGVGDNKDAFPFDPTEIKDSDGDGVGDNKDAFPFDATETKDSDGDGVGDNKDQYPNDSTRSIITLSSYYPQDKNNTWLYNTSTDKAVFTTLRNINKITIRPLQLTRDLRLYLRSSSGGIGISGLNIDELDTKSTTGVISADMIFGTEVPVLFSGMLTGELNSISDRGQIDIQPLVGFRSMNYQVDSRYIGLETVSVPYGSFRAHRVILTFTATAAADVNNAPFNVSLSLGLWFGLDTGIIKYQVISKQVTNGAVTTAMQANPVSNLVTAKVKYASNSQDLSPLIQTSKAGGGAGCSINNNATFDPVFYLLFLISCGYFIRKKIHKVNKIN